MEAARRRAAVDHQPDPQLTVKIHLDQAYGFTAELAGTAAKRKIALGGEVSNAMQSVWRRTADFPS